MGSNVFFQNITDAKCRRSIPEEKLLHHAKETKPSFNYAVLFVGNDRKKKKKRKKLRLPVDSANSQHEQHICLGDSDTY